MRLVKNWKSKNICDRIKGNLFTGKMIENDIIYLSHLEKKTEDLEDRLIDGDSDNFFEQLTKLQRKLSELNAYYEQLTAIGDLVESCTSPALVGGTEQWGRYSMRTERLSNHTRLLQEPQGALQSAAGRETE